MFCLELYAVLKGLVKYFGFSFHAEPKLLEQLLIEHPEVDFVQLQINYADWKGLLLRQGQTMKWPGNMENPLL